MSSVRIIIEVHAGLIPRQPIEQHTRQFIITSDMWYAQGVYEGRQEDAKLEILKIYGFAQEYARNLMNPQFINWVTLNWLYL